MGAKTTSVRAVLAASVGILLALSAHPAAASKLRGFPVQLEDSVESGPPLAFDIDADGQLELLIGSQHALHVIEADGNPAEGFPVKMEPGVSLVTGLSAARLGPAGSARPLVFFGTSDKRLRALDGAAKPVAGFPVLLDDVLAGPPTLVDINADGRAEIVCATRGGKVYAITPAGRVLAGYPAGCGAPVSTSVTVGRFKPGGRNNAVMLFGDEKGFLHAWSAAGRELAGFPFKAKYTISSQPVLGDTDDDGVFEIIFGSKDYKIYALNEDGSQADGFPVATGYRVYSTPALADLDADGVVDVIVAGGDGLLHAIGKGGRKIKGFPVKVGGRLRASAVVGDIDRDGRPEIAVGTEKSRLIVYRDNGQRYPGFPVRFPERIDVAPTLADLNGDGLVEIIAVSRNGSLSAYSMIKKGGNLEPLVWPMEGRDTTRSARSHPNPPRYANLAISPAEPFSTDTIRLSYRFFDLDGDPEPQTIIRWEMNGKTVQRLDGAREIPADATRKHQRWRFTLQATAKGPVFKSAVVRVRNTPPESPDVVIQPDTARCSDDLKLKIVRGSRDADGDKIRYGVAWLKDRLPVKKLHRNAVPSARTLAGQRWTVVVTPDDGEEKGMPARSTILVSNTAPSAAVVHLDPARPTVSQAVKVVVDKPGRDPDHDKVSYRYLWTAGGKPLNLPLDTAVLPPGMAAKHDKIGLEVISFDGREEGAKTRAEVEVANSVPSALEIRILPGSPTTLDDLTVEVKSPAVDDDRDRLTYDVAWRRAQKPYRGPHARHFSLPAGETHKGEDWSVSVTPTDGEGKGKPARAKVTIGNAPPHPAVFAAADPRPKTTSDLALKIVKPARDPDGDKISQEVIWYRVDAKGVKREIQRGPGLFSLPSDKTRKNTRYLSRVIPSDGTTTGSETSQWFEVQNSLPTGCRIAIKPDKPKSGQALFTELTGQSSDADGDRLEMRYRWYKDDQAMTMNPASEKVAGSLVKRGQRWMVVATPGDGESNGPACRAEIEIGNRPPPAPAIVLKPDRPRVTDSLACRVTRATQDPDGDEVKLRNVWTVDGRKFVSAGTSGTIPAGLLKKGQKWRVEVTASDGELSSKPNYATVVVADSPPGLPRVEIRPRLPLSSDDLFCHLAGPTPDPDGDSLTHSYAWFQLKGKERPTGKPKQVGRLLAASHTRKGQRWLCRAAASDGELSGAPAEVSVDIANAEPTAPGVGVVPADPGDNDELRCKIESQAQDPDGDRVRYNFAWYKDGLKQPFAPQTDRVPARLTSGNDIWQCMVSASDGSRSSTPVQSAEVVIRK
ncbi:MAG TPA: FG-GAP-like repeat-containing protein [Myxococcota bacterium]|nr:FG-GAP-like repeat-containing protein [Myxococcota bacterium]